MNAVALVYIDVRQHLRIASTLADALGEGWTLVLVGPGLPVDAASDWTAPCRAEVKPLDAPEVSRGPRAARILRRGLALTRSLDRQLDRLRDTPASRRFVVVFNDTGIAQRYLIARANRAGVRTVLVQDGLTETQHRESTAAFAFKHAVTRALLAPLGLGHLGSSRYGTSGASTVLADGPKAASFFQQRAPRARVVESGFLRPGPGDRHASADTPRLLFWAVDFLGGLSDRPLHERQLGTLERLARAMAGLPGAVRLQVRLHPGDAAHFADYEARLGGFVHVDLVDPRVHRDPFAPALPLLSVSLQSAGVFDALAAHVPSFFLEDGPALGPAWIPPVLALADVPACEAVVRRLLADSAAARALWHEQTVALGTSIRIPYDTARIRDAFA